RLVYEFLDTLGVPVTARLRKAIGGPPTRSFEAFVAFSRGVALEDSGRVKAAAVAYRQALALDPRFALAGERLEATQPPADGGRRSEQQFIAAATAPPAGSGATERRTDALGFGTGLLGVNGVASSLMAHLANDRLLVQGTVTLPSAHPAIRPDQLATVETIGLPYLGFDVKHHGNGLEYGGTAAFELVQRPMFRV